MNILHQPRRMRAHSPREQPASVALWYPQSKWRCLACPWARLGWFPFSIPWFSGVPATYVSCLSHWIATPLCLCTGVLPVWFPYRGKFCSNAAIYPRFLVWLGFNSHSWNNIPYTLPDELSHCVSVYVNVILRGYPEHIPVPVVKKSWSMDSDWSDQHWIDLSTGTSCLSFCL